MTPDLATQATTDTRRRIIDAAVEAIRTKGAAGATARAIAEIGGFNQALIYYYFGNLNGLLVATIEAASDRRMARYLTEIERIGSLEDLGNVGTELFKEDVQAGTITLISELVSAALTHPELRPEVMTRIEPWVDLAQRLIDRLTTSTTLDGVLPSRDLAWGLVALFMGMEMLTNLDGDGTRAERLLEMFTRLAPVLDPLMARN